MTDSDGIDRAILAAMPERRNRKVARIIIDVSDELGLKPGVHERMRVLSDDADEAGIPPGERVLETIAERIRALVEDGQLDGYGDLHRWRFSEISLPGKGDHVR